MSTTNYLSIIILLFSCISCGEFVNIIRKDVSTPEEKELINSALEDLTQAFQKQGITVNLYEIPVIVSDMEDEGNDGVCAFDRYIVLNINTVKNRDPSTYGVDDFKPHFYSTLLHEIGHCYFDRKHEEYTEIESLDYRLVLSNGPRESLRHHSYETIPASVMSTTSWSLIHIKLLDYYVAEIAGIARANTFQELKNYADVKIVPIDGQLNK